MPRCCALPHCHSSVIICCLPAPTTLGAKIKKPTLKSKSRLRYMFPYASITWIRFYGFVLSPERFRGTPNESAYEIIN